MNIKSIANTVLKRYRYCGTKRGYKGLYQKMLSNISMDTSGNKAGGGISDWKSKWCKYDNQLSPLSYIIFSRYIGEDINIIPLEVLAGIVETVITPVLFRAQYEDKNNLDLLFRDIPMPETLVRNIEGVYYDKEYKLVGKPLSILDGEYRPSRIILKPTRDSSGHGVRLFEFRNGLYLDSDDNILSEDFLRRKYNSNFIIQKAINQSSYMAQFNLSSVNTLRVATYRSVHTGKVHVINSVMRVGARGKNVDNAHSGGMFIGINKENGTVGRYACNWLGKTEQVFNGIDYSNNDFQIPNWDEICQVAKQVSEKILFGNLVALDIALDENNHPIIIETNVGGFSAWLFQFTTGSAFGEFTDEIMEYCWEKYKKIKMELFYK